MKPMLAFCAVLLLSTFACGQTGNDPERVVRRIVDAGSSEGHDQKVIGRLGDAGGILLTKILADRNLTSDTIDRALVVIDAVFADPTFVEVADDRQPRTTLLLLRYFDLSTNDTELKKRIADTGIYVQDRFAASLKPTKQ
jgi:hypothetical protein